MPRRSPYVIRLGEREREYLESCIRKYTSSYMDVVRAKIILYSADGLENSEIAEKIDLPRQVVSKWRKRFFEDRIDGLRDRPRRGRPPVFPP